MTGVGGANDAEPMIQEQQQLAKPASSKSFFVATLVHVLSWLLGIIDTLVGFSMVVLSCFHSKAFCLKMAGKGYGDIALPVSSLKSLLAAIEKDDQQALNDATTVDPTSMEWCKPYVIAGIKIHEATFDSPAAAILPEASKRGHFWLVRPKRARRTTEKEVYVFMVRC
jgi:Alpha/beta hydrolase domain containing 18